MDDEFCCVCKSKICTFVPFLQLNPKLHPTGNSLICHRKCFTCSVCQISLEIDSYCVTQDNILCCEIHKDSFMNSEEHFISALKKFRKYSSQILSALEGDRPGEYQLKNENVYCVCEKHPFVKAVHGYWIECTSSECLKKRISSSALDIGSNAFSDIGSGTSQKACGRMKPEEFYQHYFYGSKHWNYCVRDREIGPVIVTLKQEFRQSRDYFR